jgi:hypothetical protein
MPAPRSVLLAALFAAVACGGSSPTTPAAVPTAPAASPTAPPAPLSGGPYSRNGVFDAVVLVDAQAPQTSPSEIQRVVARAAAIFLEKTGESFRASEVVSGLARGSSVDAMARAYAATAAGNPPDGLLVLTNDANAVNFGGYSLFFVPTYPFRNDFPSPRAGVSASSMYVAVLDFDHAYARCGYDDAGNRVSDVSVGGECRGRPGTACVQRRSGRAEWMCADAVNELYADHDFFTACTVVHEFLHPFGIDPDANLDHYGTAPCRSRTGMSAADAADLRKAQISCGMCPDVFARFRKGT